jgi:hypothetical protein
MPPPNLSRLPRQGRSSSPALRILWILVAALALWIVDQGNLIGGDSDAKSSRVNTSQSIAKPNSTNTPNTELTPPSTRKTWGNLSTLQDHFNRHGKDFEAKDPDDYAAQAWLFLQRAKSEGLPAKRDKSGVLRVYDPKSRAFAAYNRNGTTKTFFKPRRRDYFEDQPGESVDLRPKP